MIITFNQLMKDLNKKDYKPVYFLYGTEPYYIDLVSEHMIDTVLDETEKAFNQVVLYGRDTSAGSLFDYCKRFPMMGQYQLIVVREAQDMDLKKDENLQYLISYFKNPSPSTILVMGFKYKSPSVKLLNAAKKEEQNIVMFESKEKSDNDLPVWISEQVKEKGYTISNKACLMLQEFLGNNLEKISNELGKLYINHPIHKQITEEVIEQYIGISKDYNIFELQRALASRDSFKVHQIIHYFAANPKENPIFKVIPFLLGLFSKAILLKTSNNLMDKDLMRVLKVNYNMAQDCKLAARNYSLTRLQDIISWLREANARAIGIDNTSVDNGELMKELVIKILA